MRLLLVLLASSTAVAGSGFAQPAAFRYQPASAKSGLLLRYQKSNLDGSHASDIFLYLAATDRLESFKWSKGDTSATLVKAWMDTTRLTVKVFESWRVSKGTRQKVAALEAVPGTDSIALVLAGNRRTSVIEQWPWHSYDFDFAGLGWSLPHLVAPEAKATIGIADVAPTAAGVVMANRGPVTLEFVRRERWNGREARRYSIDGPGLDHKGGSLWGDLATGMLAGFEIKQPDEPGMESGKLVLVAVEPMTETGWTAFQATKLSGAR